LLYNLYGLVGIGIASVVNFSLYGFYVYYIVNKNYDFSFRNDTVKIIVFSIFAGLVCCVSAFFVEELYFRIVTGIVFLISVIFSYIALDKRISFKIYFDKLLKRK
jgi:peptidoglycan biosynthesis protein MviN/MurJ (putative lipid II flippase)